MRIFFYALFLGICLGSSVQAQPVEIHLDPAIAPEEFSGRVYLFFSAGQSEPRQNLSWFAPEPIVALDVQGWKPAGGPLRFHLESEALLRFPQDLDLADIKGLRAQALIRLNPLERSVPDGPGNGFSKPVNLSADQPAVFRVDRVIPEPEFPETRWTKELRVPSKLLSEFHGRPVTINASVTVPESYFRETAQRYPVILEVPGFGGTHRMDSAIHSEPVKEKNRLSVEFLRVMLDPSCPLGHHVFANSANNGPWRDALIQEFLPELDRQYRTAGGPRGRFLTGHSSGGWSSLWLMVSSPEQFAGVWSTAPDPVDFRDFQQIDLYQDANMYVDSDGNRRPLARRNGEVVLWYDRFCQFESILGPGGQLHSFEAVFSPRSETGTPRLLWDRETGAIDHDVAETWREYDINALLRENWETLGPKLQGKIHIFMGTEDTFYLEGATENLRETLSNLGSDAEIEMIPGRDHFTLFAGGLHERIEQQMAQQYLDSRVPVLQND